METRWKVRSFDSRLTPREFTDVPRFPLIVVLDNLRSAFNVGSVVRTADGSKTLWDQVFPLPVALVLGNEALGVSKEALEWADGVVEVPVMGYKNSINVAVAFGIAAYEIQRQHWNTVRSTLASRKKMEAAKIPHPDQPEDHR